MKNAIYLVIIISLTSATHSFLDGFVSSANSFLGVVGSGASNLAGTVKQGTTSLAGNVKEGTGNIVNAIGGGATTAVNTIGSGTSTLIGTVSEGTGNLIGAAKKETDNFANTVKMGAGVVKDGTVNFGNTVKDGTTNIAGKIGDETVSIVGAVGQGTLNLAGKTKQGTQELAHTIKQGTTNLANTIGDGTVNVVNTIGTGAVTNVFAPIGEGSITLASKSQQAGQKILETANGAIETGMKGLGDFGYTAGRVASDAGNKVQQGTSTVVNVMATVKDKIVEGVQTVGNGIVYAKDSVVEGFVYVRDGIFGKAIQFTETIKSGINTISTAVTNGIDKIKQIKDKFVIFLMAAFAAVLIYIIGSILLKCWNCCQCLIQFKNMFGKKKQCDCRSIHTSQSRIQVQHQNQQKFEDYQSRAKQCRNSIKEKRHKNQIIYYNEAKIKKNNQNKQQEKYTKLDQSSINTEKSWESQASQVSCEDLRKSNQGSETTQSFDEDTVNY